MQNNSDRIAFYGNSSTDIGAGHIMRMFALAQVASEQFDVIFVYKKCTASLVNKLHEEGFDTLKVSGTLNYAELDELKATALVVDDYYLTDAEWSIIKNLDTYIVNLDDGLNDDVLYADLVVNPVAKIDTEKYKTRAPGAELCLGPKYSYIRKEFSDTVFVPVNQRTNILVMLGGTDPKSLALPICKTLLESSFNYNVQLLIGRSHHQQEALEELQAENEHFSIVLNPPSVSHYMMQAGLAISAAGGTLGELASLGVPTIALVTVDNQTAALNSDSDNDWLKVVDFRQFKSNQQSSDQDNLLLCQIKALVDILWSDNCSKEHMSLCARQLIDTHGCRRTIDKLSKCLETRHKD